MEEQEINSPDTKNGKILMTNEEQNITSLGQTLKKAREDKGFSIEMISRHTKINTSTLHAIEKNDTENLPNIAYLRGFVKSYAKIVNIDEEAALNMLNELFNIHKDIESEKVIPEEKEVGISTKPIENRSNNQDSQTSQESDEKTKSLIVKSALGIGIIVIVSAFFLITSTSGDKDQTTQTKNESNPEEIKTVQINENTPLKEVVEQTSPVVATEDSEPEEAITEPTLEKIEKVEEAKEEIEVKAEVKVEEKEEVVQEAKKIEDETITQAVEEEKEEQEEKIRFYNISLPMFEILDDQEALAQYVPESFKSSVIAGKQNLFINAANGDTWITYKKDSDPIKKFILKKGRYLMIRGDEIKIFFGNVLETKVFLNNQLLSINTKSGVKSIVLPESLAMKTKLPLFIFNKDGSVQTSDEYISKLEEETETQD